MPGGAQAARASWLILSADKRSMRVMVTKTTLGQRIRALRKRSDQTLRACARNSAISPQYLSDIELDRRPHPSDQVIGAIAIALGTIPDKLRGRRAGRGCRGQAGTGWRKADHGRGDG